MQVDTVRTRVESAYDFCIQRWKLQYRELLSTCALNFNLCRYAEKADDMNATYANILAANYVIPPGALTAEASSFVSGLLTVGRCRFEPMIPVLKAPGTTLLKPRYDDPLSNFAFNFNLRRYMSVDYQQRLGCGRTGMFEVKAHPWFQGLDWGMLLERRIQPPILPEVGRRRLTDSRARRFRAYEEAPGFRPGPRRLTPG